MSHLDNDLSDIEDDDERQRQDIELDRQLRDEVLPVVRGPKLAFFVADPEAFAKWCEANDQTPEETLGNMVANITPKDRERSDD